MSSPILSADLVSALRKISPFGVHTSVSLASVSRWRIGGLAKVIIAPRSTREVQHVMAYVHRYQVPYVVLGSTSNLLFADEGLDVLGIHLGNNLSDLRIDGSAVWSECGVWVPGFARKLARTGLTGAEHTCGIPGTLGGLLCMNGGSQRKGIGDNVVEVTAVTEKGELKHYDTDACRFGYRQSVFQQSRELIVSARFNFEPAESKGQVRQRMLSILKERRTKFPRKLPNCGSVFVSNPAMYADYGPPGAVIEQCGLKGLQRGGAIVSLHHANFIINRGTATAADVLGLIQTIRCAVKQRTGYDMPAEVRYVSSAGEIVPAHVQAKRNFGDLAMVNSAATETRAGALQ